MPSAPIATPTPTTSSPSLFIGPGDGPVGQVFATSELLEIILLELPLPSILKAKAVCKTFETAFKLPTIKMKQHIFQQPIKDDVRWLVDGYDVKESKPNEANLVAAVPADSPEMKEIDARFILTPIRLNPLLLAGPFSPYDDDDDDRLDIRQRGSLRGRNLRLRLTISEIRHLVKTKNEALGMFLTQPPVRSLTVHWLYLPSLMALRKKMAESRIPSRQVFVDGGVRLKDIWDAVKGWRAIPGDAYQLIIDVCGEVVVVKDGDEEEMRVRTAEWREERQVMAEGMRIVEKAMAMVEGERKG